MASYTREDIPLLYQKNPVKFNAFGLFWNIVKAFAGAGSFALPWAMKQAGLWTGIVGVLFMAIISNYTIKILTKCGQRVFDDLRSINGAKIDRPSYPEIARVAMGRWGPALVSVYSAAMCFGVCTAYFTLIADNMSDIITALSKPEIIWITFVIVSFLSVWTDMKYFSYTSIAGSAALLIAIGSVIIFGLRQDLMKSITSYPAFRWETIPLFLGSAAFLFLSHVIVLPLANSSGDFTRFPLVLDLAMTFVLVVNIFFATFAYMFWADGTCQNVIKNLGEGIVSDIVRIGISLEVLASFPLVASSGFQSLEFAFPIALRRVYAFPNLEDTRRPFFSRNFWYYVFRIVIIALLALLASTIKGFGALISLVGSFTVAATGFVFPQIFYLRLFKSLPLWEKVLQYLVILFGVGLTVLGTFLALKEIIEPSSAC